MKITRWPWSALILFVFIDTCFTIGYVRRTDAQLGEAYRRIDQLESDLLDMHGSVSQIVQIVESAKHGTTDD